MPQIIEGREEDLGDGTMRVFRVSLFSGREHVRILPITPAQLVAWRGGMLVQHAFPRLSPDDCEFLLTGAIGDEWDDFVTDDDDLVEDGDADAPALGQCCICETTVGVVNIVTLDRRAPIAGHGWGCMVCDLPPDGASAVLCGLCIRAYLAGEQELRFACRGYPASEGRIPIDDLPDGEFAHDQNKHADEAA
jgi:hypothetical protein